MRKPLLLLPGPMQVPAQVLQAAERPMFSHRSAEMIELLLRLEGGVQPLFGTNGDVLFLAASGTGAMESAICNLTSPGDEVIVAVGGVFAARWAEIASAYGLTVHQIDSDWRNGTSLDQVEQALSRWPRAEVVFHTWSESSTGVLNDLNDIGKFLRAHNKIFVADAVSGLAVSPMTMDEWNIDAVIAGSQKGLMLPPGLALVAVNARAWAKNARARLPRFYWDWKRYKQAIPFTPAQTLLFQLEASLNWIHSEGLERVFGRRAEVANRIRNVVIRSNMEVYALKPGNGITGVIPPSNFDIATFCRRLESQFGIQIADGLGKLKDKIFRIGHVGHLTNEELDYFVESFERCLTRELAQRT
jgi:serine---pyruvate transaminase